MSGTGDFTFGANGYNGQIRMKGKWKARTSTWTQAIDARRVGGLHGALSWRDAVTGFPGRRRGCPQLAGLSHHDPP